jgi:hypothetical protein
VVGVDMVGVDMVGVDMVGVDVVGVDVGGVDVVCSVVCRVHYVELVSTTEFCCVEPHLFS